MKENRRKGETKKQYLRRVKLYMRKHRLTYKGVTADLFANMTTKSNENGGRYKKDSFTLEQFRLWVKTTNFEKLFDTWKRNGHRRDDRPSVDRIDVLKGYSFGNMRITTCRDNYLKGFTEKTILFGRPVYQLSKNGKKLAKYESITIASLATGINRGNIGSCIVGRPKHSVAGGYKWIYATNNSVINRKHERK